MELLNVACSTYGLDSTTATEVRECTDPIADGYRAGTLLWSLYGRQLRNTHAQHTATVWSGLYGNKLWSGPYMYGIQLPRLHCKQLLF